MLGEVPSQQRAVLSPDEWANKAKETVGSAGKKSSAADGQQVQDQTKQQPNQAAAQIKQQQDQIKQFEAEVAELERQIRLPVAEVEGATKQPSRRVDDEPPPSSLGDVQKQMTEQMQSLQEQMQEQMKEQTLALSATYANGNGAHFKNENQVCNYSRARPFLNTACENQGAQGTASQGT